MSGKLHSPFQVGKEAAAHLGCSQSILCSLTWDGVIPHLGELPSITFSRVELDAWLVFWHQEATAETLIMLVGGYVREHDIGLKGRLYLHGLLRPEEQAKLPRQRAWSQDFIRYLINETTRARVGTSTPSAVVGHVQADTSPSSRSLERQREAIMQWCQARRLKLVAIYEDVGMSNMAPLDQRPGLQEALSALTLGSVLLAFEWDRLTTHLLTAVGLQQIVFQAGAWILTVKDER